MKPINGHQQIANRNLEIANWLIDCPPLPRIDGQCQYKMHGTHGKVHSIQFIWDKKYDFSVFGGDLTDAFAVVIILLKLPKNE